MSQPIRLLARDPEGCFATLTAADLEDFTDWSHQALSGLDQQELKQFIMDDDTDTGGWLTN